VFRRKSAHTGSTTAVPLEGGPITAGPIAAGPIAVDTVPLPAAEPVVLPVTRPLTRQTAVDVVDQIDRLAGDVQVIVDLTAIPSFDIDGADVLLRLQDGGERKVSIVGFRQAASRLMAAEEAPAPRVAETGWCIRRLRTLAVVQPSDGELLSTDDLEPTLAEAIALDAAIVVVDLRNTLGLTPIGLQSIAFASSSAALRGQELLIVNVTKESAEMLRGAGLSATTFVSPEPPVPGLPAW
jgi:anti-anti-sigma regulatory factor